MRNVIAILFLLLSVVSFAQDNNTPVPFTLGDRDRLMRNEQKIESLHVEIDALRTEMNVRFKNLDQKMDIKFESQQRQINMIITLLFFLLGGMMLLMGLVIYDRRTAITPVQRSQKKLEDILVEYSKENKKLRELLKNAGML
jgi:hypothetical protein